MCYAGANGRQGKVVNDGTIDGWPHGLWLTGVWSAILHLQVLPEEVIEGSTAGHCLSASVAS